MFYDIELEKRFATVDKYTREEQTAVFESFNVARTALNTTIFSTTFGMNLAVMYLQDYGAHAGNNNIFRRQFLKRDENSNPIPREAALEISDRLIQTVRVTEPAPITAEDVENILALKPSRLIVNAAISKLEAYKALLAHPFESVRECAQKELRIPPSEYEKICDAARKQSQHQERIVEDLTARNLRLVFSYAKKRAYSEDSFCTNMGTGGTGLLTALERFEVERGFAFSTFATRHIKQAIGIHIKNNRGDIRVPVHRLDKLEEVKKVTEALLQIYSREPTHEEIAQSMGLNPKQLKELLQFSPRMVYLDAPVSDKGDGTMANFYPAAPEASSTTNNALSKDLELLLEGLSPVEREIIIHRFGFQTGESRTLEGIAVLFDVTRERIRQIGDKALRKLRHPSKIKLLKKYKEHTT
jgi:RNA polymerase sigma factor (sigma-70 family)